MKYSILMCLLSALVAGCSSSSSDGGSDSGPTDPKSLVSSDIAALQNVNANGLRAFDNQQNGLFTKIFGGTDADAIHNYLFTRIRYFYSPTDLKHLRSQPDDFRYKGWYSQPQKQNTIFADGTVELGAANIGTQLWISGLVDSVPVTVYDGDQTIQVDSSRAGLMLIGPGYKAVDKDRQGTSFAVPREARQAILIHEARHSDCTGGITQNDLQTLRQMHDAVETDARYSNRACGHFHTYCHSGTYAGYQACDDRPWGAYAIQYVYLRATVNNYAENTIPHEYLLFSIGDTYSRFLTDDVLNGALDMSSEGLR